MLQSSVYDIGDPAEKNPPQKTKKNSIDQHQNTTYSVLASDIFPAGNDRLHDSTIHIQTLKR